MLLTTSHIPSPFSEKCWKGQAILYDNTNYINYIFRPSTNSALSVLVIYQGTSHLEHSDQVGNNDYLIVPKKK